MQVDLGDDVLGGGDLFVVEHDAFAEVAVLLLEGFEEGIVLSVALELVDSLKGLDEVIFDEFELLVEFLFGFLFGFDLADLLNSFFLLFTL
jgi:hypothetical protein